MTDELADRYLEIAEIVRRIKTQWREEHDLEVGDRPSFPDPLVSLPGDLWGVSGVANPTDPLRRRLNGLNARFGAAYDYAQRWENVHRLLRSGHGMLNGPARAEIDQFRSQGVSAYRGQLRRQLTMIDASRLVAEGMYAGIEFAACAVGGVRRQLQEIALRYRQHLQRTFPMPGLPSPTPENQRTIFRLVQQYGHEMDRWIIPLDRRIAELARWLDLLADLLIGGPPGRSRREHSSLNRRLPFSDQDAYDFATANTRYRRLIGEELEFAQRRLALSPTGEEARDLRSRIATYNRLLQPDVTVLYFDPVGRSGDAEIAAGVGPLDRSARHIGLVVTGTGSDINNFDMYLDEMKELGERAGPRTGMILYLGGDFPDNPVLDAPSNSYSRDMAPDLVNFSRQLRQEVGDNVTITAIGHSYGGTVVGTAAVLGADFNQIVHVSSAGLGYQADSVSDYTSPNLHGVYSLTVTGEGYWRPPLLPGTPPTWVTTSEGDAIEIAQSFGATWIHGTDPDRAPGVHWLDAGHVPAGSPWNPVSIHTDWWMSTGGRTDHDPDRDTVTMLDEHLARLLKGDPVVPYHRSTNPEPPPIRTR